jgi:hypothetical protein
VVSLPVIAHWEQRRLRVLQEEELRRIFGFKKQNQRGRSKK